MLTGITIRMAFTISVVRATSSPMSDGRSQQTGDRRLRIEGA
jgi:hypothetical protein